MSVLEIIWYKTHIRYTYIWYLKPKLENMPTLWSTHDVNYLYFFILIIGHKCYVCLSIVNWKYTYTHIMRQEYYDINEFLINGIADGIFKHECDFCMRLYIKVSLIITKIRQDDCFNCIICVIFSILFHFVFKLQEN